MSGVATTNDLEAVAILKEIQAVNAIANPTPTAPLVNVVCLALAAILTTATSYYAGHKHGKASGAIDTLKTIASEIPDKGN